MPSALDQLRNGIVNLREETAYGKHYINPRSLKDLCTRELINNAVKISPFRQASKGTIVDTIMEKGVVIFSILVYMREEKLMTSFLDRHRLDDKIPMNFMDLEYVAPEIAKMFVEVQWEFVPVTMEKHKHKELERLEILPIKRNKRLADRDGSYGDMYEIDIDSSMQDIVEPKVDLETGSNVSQICHAWPGSC